MTPSSLRFLGRKVFFGVLVLLLPVLREGPTPERLARLCGYGIYSGLIGHIDKHDPIELLGDAPPTGMVWDVL